MACKQQKFPGKLVVIRYFIGCPDELPTEADWKRLGSLRTKDYTIEWDDTDGTDADSTGSIRDAVATFMNLTLSGDGTARATGDVAASITELEKHVSNPIATGGQPTAWFQIIDPRLTRTCYMMINSFSPLSAPFDDLTTWSFEAKSAASDFGLIVEDTPDPDADDVATVTAFPEIMTLAIGGSQRAAAVIAPATAPQGIQWISSDPAVATVDQTGVVRGVSIGDATITARASADASKTDTVEVSVE